MSIRINKQKYRETFFQILGFGKECVDGEGLVTVYHFRAKVSK